MGCIGLGKGHECIPINAQLQEEEVEVMEGGASEIGEPDVVLQEEEEEEDVTFDLEEEEV